VTKLTRSEVQAWSDRAHELMADSPLGRSELPACAVLDSVNEVAHLCDALLEAWDEYHTHPAPEVEP
jgi:hypothetical protein